MPFIRPTRATIQARVAADIERYTGKSATSRGDIYYPITQAMTGLSHGLHGHLSYNADQLFDDSCDDETLLRRAAEMAIYRIQAYRSAGTATITGNDGAQVLAEELLQTDAGVLYRITDAATIIDGTAVVNVIAVDAGAAGNLDPGTTLRFVSAQLDIDSQATVITMTGGSDIETIDRVRERLADRRKNPAMGGNKADYVAWVKAAHSDITRAWCYPNEAGLGTVTVRFVTEDLASPIPSQTHIDAVEAYVDEQRPAGMKRFYALAPAAKTLDLVFTSLSPNTTAVRTAIIAELQDLLRREAEPGGTLFISKIREAISLAAGEDNYVLTLSDDVSSLTGEFLVLGDITWPAA